MRRRTTGPTFALLVGAVSVVFLVLTLVGLPAGVQCKEVKKIIEESGDPDMPDRASTGISDALSTIALVPADGCALQVESGSDADTSQRASHKTWYLEQPGEFMVMWRHALMLRLWSSIAPWLIAF
jgi:hypothetical protein